MSATQRSGNPEQGAALVTALVLVLVVMTLGVSASRASLAGEKSARLERDRRIALAAAGAALDDAERDIAGAAGVQPARAALFDGSATGFSDGCGRGADDLGLCRPAGAPNPPVWQQVDLAGDKGVTVPYGAFTDAQLATGGTGQPARLPRYIIELVPVPGATQAHGSFYRVTAIGFGTREGTVAVLQSFYRKSTPAPVPGGTPSAPPVPEGRIGWREVANWPELHAKAVK